MCTFNQRFADSEKRYVIVVSTIQNNIPNVKQNDIPNVKQNDILNVKIDKKNI